MSSTPEGSQHASKSPGIGLPVTKLPSSRTVWHPALRKAVAPSLKPENNDSRRPGLENFASTSSIVASCTPGGKTGQRLPISTSSGIIVTQQYYCVPGAATRILPRRGADQHRIEHICPRGFSAIFLPHRLGDPLDSTPVSSVGFGGWGKGKVQGLGRRPRHCGLGMSEFTRHGTPVTGHGVRTTKYGNSRSKRRTRKHFVIKITTPSLLLLWLIVTTCSSIHFLLASGGGFGI